MPAKGLAVLCLAVTVTDVAWAQAAATALQSTLGTVTKIDATARTLSVKTDAGQEFAVTLQAKATVQRIPPGQTDVSKAEAIALGDVEVGDRVLARGTVDNLNVSATRIVVMSKGDIAKMQDAERADWDKRGVTGLVTAVAGGFGDHQRQEPHRRQADDDRSGAQGHRAPLRTRLGQVLRRQDFHAGGN